MKIRTSHARLLCLLVLAVLPFCGPVHAQGLTIVQQPASVLNALLGQTNTFSVTAQTTNAVLHYQWRRNGANILGATNLIYTVFNVQGTNSGAYSVVVTDGVSTVTSATASLTANIATLVGGILNQIGITSGITRSSNVGVQATTIPVVIPGNRGGHPVIFTWTPLYSGIVTFSTEGSDFETIIGAFTGSSGNLQQVPSSVNGDDSAGFHNSQISFNAQGLTQYQIVVDGYNGASGNIVLSWSEDVTTFRLATFTLVPPRVMAASNGAPFTFSANYDTGSLLWYFNGAPTAITSSQLTISQADDATVGSYFAEVSNGKGNNSATRAADLQIAVLEDGSTPTNSFAWKHFSDAVAYPFALPVGKAVQKFSGGGDSRGYSVSQTFSTVGAIAELGEPVLGNQIGGAPEWYVYVTPTNGTMEVDTSGSSFNTILGVFTGPGDSFLTLTNLAYGYNTNGAANGQPKIFLPNVPAHRTNYILVDGENGASGTVHLHINIGAPVSIATPPSDQPVLQGRNASFTVTAFGSTNIGYFWQFAGTNITGATNSTLTITNVQPSQVGYYTVIVSNLVSTATTNALLSLLYPPAITNQPQSQDVVAGGTASFMNLASGTMPLGYQWRIGNVPVPNATNSTLTFNPVTTNQAGSYSCVVSNVAGAVTSSVVTLTVDTLPVIAIPPVSQTVTANSNVVLTVTASGLPSPSYAWYFNGLADGITTSSLTLPSFQTAQQGAYFVVVSNRAGTVTSAPAYLALNQPLRASQLLVTNGQFQFQLIGSAGSNYVIQASTDLTIWISLVTNTATNGYLDFTDTNAALFPGRFYRTEGQ